jgi:hypothetical protein
MGSRGNQGTQQLCRPRWGVATSPFAGGATSCSPEPSASGGRGPRAASTSVSTRSMLPRARGADTTARGDGAFRAPPGAGPRRVRALEVPGAARFAVPHINAPRRKGPPALGAHRAGTFSLFLLPGGAPAALCPRARSGGDGGSGRTHRLGGH